MRERYNALMQQPQKIEEMLREGAAVARERHGLPLMRRLREAVGLRDLSKLAENTHGPARTKVSMPQFKQYRESDGNFYFKLVDGEGNLLAQSTAFSSPQEAGRMIAFYVENWFHLADDEPRIANGAYFATRSGSGEELAYFFIPKEEAARILQSISESKKTKN